jgi:hypothetical protein
MNFANSTLRSFAKKFVNDSRIAVSVFPASAIATPLPVNYNIANFYQDSAK